MDKNRLLQIVNRLELSPKDKADLVNIINNNTEKIEKLLENVPEDLDTLKEIANTPANFLNNNHELGGMINMPFGYIDFVSRSFINLDISTEESCLMDMSDIPSYYKGLFIVDTNEYNFNISDSDNLIINVGTAQISIKNKHIYIRGYFPNTRNINIVFYLDILKLHNKFIPVLTEENVAPSIYLKDWNADESMDGHIKNRTHYVTKTKNSDHLIDKSKTNEWVTIGSPYKEGFYEINGKEIFMKYGEEYKLSNIISTCYIRLNSNTRQPQIKWNSGPSNVKEYVTIYELTITPLSEYYIPDTIARTADYEALEARIAELEAKLNAITVTVDE